MDRTTIMKYGVAVATKAQQRVLDWIDTESTTLDDIYSGLTYDREGFLEADLNCAMEDVMGKDRIAILPADEHIAIMEVARPIYETTIQALEEHYTREYEARKLKYTAYIYNRVAEMADVDTEQDGWQQRIDQEYSENEVFDMVLRYEGIIGYSDKIKSWVHDIFKVDIYKEGR